jgi:hypothetical protein
MTTTIITASDLLAALDLLSQTRMVWEEGSVKKSNDELFDILAKCVGIYSQLVLNRQLRKNMTDALTARKIHFNQNASLGTRVVRWVFGECGKRAYTYANVIEAAVQKDIKSDGVAAWIVANGGIESIRRSGKSGVPEAQRKRELRKSAEEYFNASDALFEIPTKVPALAPSAGASHAFSVALVRQSKSGTSEIVYGSKNGTLVNSLLVEAGKLAAVQLKSADVSSKQNDRANNLSVVISDITNGAESL